MKVRDLLLQRQLRQATTTSTTATSPTPLPVTLTTTNASTGEASLPHSASTSGDDRGGASIMGVCTTPLPAPIITPLPAARYGWLARSPWSIVGPLVGVSSHWHTLSRRIRGMTWKGLVAGSKARGTRWCGYVVGGTVVCAKLGWCGCVGFWLMGFPFFRLLALESTSIAMEAANQ
ncbi:hypothetical protein Pelo_8774 [Pelomyxa schiedti]|nr:hypothetical protein Pelo_8774 [Pelomyxa schiedti]